MPESMVFRIQDLEVITPLHLLTPWQQQVIQDFFKLPDGVVVRVNTSHDYMFHLADKLREQPTTMPSYPNEIWAHWCEGKDRIFYCSTEQQNCPVCNVPRTRESLPEFFDGSGEGDEGGLHGYKLVDGAYNKLEGPAFSDRFWGLNGNRGW
jgi:hypothetical protein